MFYIVEVVWNREFDWSQYSNHDNLYVAIEAAKQAENSGDGARVKKARVVDSEGKVRWAYGKMVTE